MSHIVLVFLAACYRSVYKLHHKLCLRPGKPLKNSRLVVVGSFRTGGAGKTPFCIWLANHLAAQERRVALLCHEYAFDEITMLREKFSHNTHVEVFATRNRYRTAHELDLTQKFDVILCDDGFEDSRLVGATTIVLSWEDIPTKISDLWPLENMRSLSKDHEPVSKNFITLNCNGDSPDIRFVLDKVSSPVVGDFPSGRKAIVFCGIGAPERFRHDIQNAGFQVLRLDAFRDHCRNFAQKMASTLQKEPDSAVITSEKDAARLPDGFFQRNKRVYIASQKTLVSPSALQKLKDIGL